MCASLECLSGAKVTKVPFTRAKRVFAKLWDGWKHSSEASEREFAVYNSIRYLWGSIVPTSIAHGGWGFCHVIVLKFIQVHHLQFSLMLNNRALSCLMLSSLQLLKRMLSIGSNNYINIKFVIVTFKQ